MRSLLNDYLGRQISRRVFMQGLAAMGLAASDVRVARTGAGADSTWYQAYNLAAERKRKV